MRILLIEDDKQAAAYLVKGLDEAGFNVEHASDGRDGLYLATSEPFDLIIVNRMLPGLDGLAIIQALRAQGHKTPILILSALAQVDDRVRGLRAGGDDYLTKPYSFAELMARIEALLRRGQAQAVVTTLEVAGLHMDLMGRTVARDGRRIELQPLYMAFVLGLEGFIRYSTHRHDGPRDPRAHRSVESAGITGTHAVRPR